NRGPMRQHRDIVRRSAGLLENGFDPANETDRRIGRRACDFGDVHEARAALHRHDIGEGTAGIDADAQPRLSRRRCHPSNASSALANPYPRQLWAPPRARVKTRIHAVGQAAFSAVRIRIMYSAPAGRSHFASRFGRDRACRNTLMKRRLMVGLVAGVALTAASGAAIAHHSTAMFDQENPIELVGTVKEFKFTNPHTFILLEVKGADGG